MTTRFQARRGTTAEHAIFTGAVGEVTVDTDKDCAVVHDGSTSGGFPIARADVSNVSNPQFSGTSSLLLPKGTTAQRPSSATNGQIRYNTTITQCEIYQDGYWNPIGTVLQTKYVIDDTQANYTSGTLAKITTLSATITPISPRSKIVIEIGLNGGSYVGGIGYYKDNTIANHITANRSSAECDAFQISFSGGSAGGQNEPNYYRAVMSETAGSTTARTYYAGAAERWANSNYIFYYNRRADGTMDGTSYMFIQEIFQE